MTAPGISFSLHLWLLLVFRLEQLFVSDFSPKFLNFLHRNFVVSLIFLFITRLPVHFLYHHRNNTLLNCRNFSFSSTVKENFKTYYSIFNDLLQQPVLFGDTFCLSFFAVRKERKLSKMENKHFWILAFRQPIPKNLSAIKLHLHFKFWIYILALGFS